jgi:putative salt-induced outer membrane protein YdiY
VNENLHCANPTFALRRSFVKRIHWLVVCAGLAFSIVAQGGVVIFKNGDKITGTVTELAGGKLKISSTVAGDVVVEVKDVQTFSTDTPARIKMSGGEKMKTALATSPTTQAVTADGKPLPIADIKSLDTRDEKWSGSILVNGLLTEGNSHSESLGVDAAAQLRRNDETNDDRFTLAGSYNLGREKPAGGGATTTSVDNWYALGKYDRFWTEKWYGYASVRADHDRIADLFLRITPGIGVGYQWVESPDFNFNTEAGVNYIYENYDPGDTDNRIALRFAYHVDKKLNDKVTLFHDLEYLPAVDDPGDYLLNTDAGVRATLTKSFFTEFKVEWKRDSTPAPGALKNDLRYVLGVGWQF